LKPGTNFEQSVLALSGASKVYTQSLDEALRKALLAYIGKLRLTRWPHYWESLLDARSPKPPSAVLANA
jgi:hypothetical protein